ncbi:hypothetical protein [Agromyces sp. NPDC060279]|uniref:hypothetical protein n=1 Tax=Agromyces sp. NPDC060279 TaxID=3347092 RepID=UPI00364A02DC
MTGVAALAFCGVVLTATTANASGRTTGDQPPVSVESLGGAIGADGARAFTTEGSQLTVLPATGPTPSAEELNTLAATITCGLDVQYVHASSHVSGTINGVAVITCSGPAGSLKLDYSLIRTTPNYKQWGAGQKTNVGKASLQNNRAVNCSEGPASFGGWAQGVISPPAGYTLVGSAKNSKWGTVRTVACGVSFSALNDDSEISSSVSVTFVRDDLVG